MVLLLPARSAGGRPGTGESGGGVSSASSQVEAARSRQDAELAKLNRRLDETIVPYGTAREREEADHRRSMARGMAAPEAAERASFKAKAGRVDRSDLVDAIRDGDVDLDELDARVDEIGRVDAAGSCDGFHDSADRSRLRLEFDADLLRVERRLPD